MDVFGTDIISVPKICSAQLMQFIMLFMKCNVLVNKSLPRTGFVDKLRSRLQYIPQTAKTARFQHSFLIYALNNYQT